MRNRRKSLKNRGFTLIELLVAISIIAILLAIAVVGFRALQKSAATKKARTALANAASMLAEYEVSTGLRRQPTYMWTPAAFPATPMKYTASGFDIWRDADPTLAGMDRLTPPLNTVDTDEPKRLESHAVLNTAVALTEVQKAAGAKKFFTQLPTDSMLTVNEPGITPPVAVGPVLLDGWDNPIIFVPASGLEVILGDPPALYVVTSAKTYVPGTAAGQLGPGVLAPNARTFFASAGPDGVFTFVDVNGNGSFDTGTDIPGGDDNVYSFEN